MTKKKKMNRGVAKAIKVFGSQHSLAARLKVAQPSVHLWLWGNCPAERAVELEKVSGVSRHEIRPDIFGRKKNG